MSNSGAAVTPIRTAIYMGRGSAMFSIGCLAAFWRFCRCWGNRQAAPFLPPAVIASDTAVLTIREQASSL